MEEETKQEETKQDIQAEGQDQGQGEVSRDEGAEKEKPLDKMTAKELREVALQIPGISGVHAMKKEELLVAIKEARGIKEEEPPRKAKKPIRTDLSVKDIKKKIAGLKAEKEASLESGDRKKRDVLRRRINRLKKRTRKVA